MLNSHYELEKAKVLGFDSIEEMQEHAQWLERLRVHREQVREAVNVANAMGSPIIIVPEWKS